MKPERDLKYSVILLGSKFVRRTLFHKNIGGCKQDFERLVGAPDHSSEFKEWFNELIEEGSIVSFKKEYVGVKANRKVDTYLVEYKVLHRRLKSNPVYPLIFKVVQKSLLG